MTTRWFGAEPEGPHPYQPGCLCPPCTRCRNADAENAEQAARIGTGKAAADEEVEAYRARLRAAMADDREPLIMPGTGGPFAVTRIRETRPGVWVPDGNGTDAIRAAPDPVPEAEPEPEDEAARIAAVIAQPLGLYAAELDKQAPYGIAAEGACRTCFAAVQASVPEDGRHLCWECRALETVNRRVPGPAEAELLRRAAACTHGPKAKWVRDGKCTRCGVCPAPRIRDHRPHPVPAHHRLILLGAAIVLLVMAGHGLLPLILPAIAFIGLALSGLRR